MRRAWVPRTRRKTTRPVESPRAAGEVADRERLRAQTPLPAFRGPGCVGIVGNRAQERARHAGMVQRCDRAVKMNRAVWGVALASQGTGPYSRRPLSATV